jgi:hypothetical protein
MPPPPPPPSYANLPAAYAFAPPQPLQPSPGLRTFLIVFLAIDIAVTGLFSLFGLLAVAGGTDEPSGAIFWAVFLILLTLAVVGLVGVVARAVWARWVALAAGIAVSLTCLGLAIGIPIIVAAARAPLGKPV